MGQKANHMDTWSTIWSNNNSWTLQISHHTCLLAFGAQCNAKRQFWLLPKAIRDHMSSLKENGIDFQRHVSDDVHLFMIRMMRWIKMHVCSYQSVSTRSNQNQIFWPLIKPQMVTFPWSQYLSPVLLQTKERLLKTTPTSQRILTLLPSPNFCPPKHLLPTPHPLLNYPPTVTRFRAWQLRCPLVHLRSLITLLVIPSI